MRSNHCVAAVFAAIAGSPIRNRASEHIRSARIGFRLYAIADDPTCSASNGSSISWRWASSRRSVPHLCVRLAEAAERVQDLRIDLPRIGLPSDGNHTLEAHLLGHKLVELLHLVVVAVEEREEARLCAGRSLGAAERQFIPAPFQFL